MESFKVCAFHFTWILLLSIILSVEAKERDASILDGIDVGVPKLLGKVDILLNGVFSTTDDLVDFLVGLLKGK
ncbi:hypothetical protein HNY73_018952 [Argiope bruennichi]|uniref:Uncharacterized protein n=1 Tax=Argiope bruennichi TaxID=94029 RepID=A0A8T0EEW0_ARGBR|nr:hypothetical protein HNY73_018952 [Argiope bruennichi]